MAILVAGGVLVAALVVWALTRTVEPPATVDTTTFATTTPPAAPVTDTGFLASNSTSPSPLSPTSPAPVPSAEQSADKGGVTRIAAEDLRAKMGRGEVVVIDVRDTGSYAAEHIPGAVNMPLATIEGQIDSLPKGKAIVTYCT